MDSKWKVLMFAFAAILLVATVSVNAQEDNPDRILDDDNDAMLMMTGRGAELRFLQLERQITRNVLRGQAIVDYLNENTSNSSNTTRMVEILDEMELLVNEINNVSYNKTNQELVQQFLDIKFDASKLSKEFRTETEKHLNTSARAALRRSLESIDDSDLSELDDIIDEHRRIYNADRLERLFGLLGIDDDAFIESVRNGEVSPSEIRERLRDAFGDLTIEQKLEFAASIRSEFSDMQDFRVKFRVKFKDGFMERIEIREQERHDMFDDDDFMDERRGRGMDSMHDRLERFRLGWDDDSEDEDDNSSGRGRGRGSDD